jgi:hypothetical protein
MHCSGQNSSCIAGQLTLQISEMHLSTLGYLVMFHPVGLQVGGWWHYEATRLVYGDGVFFSSRKDAPLPPLLVLDPSIQLNAESSKEMKRLHLGLILAGYLSNRVWVWPRVDCASKRFSHVDHSVIWTNTTDPNALFYGGQDNLKCIDLELTWNYCMEVCVLPALD